MNDIIREIVERLALENAVSFNGVAKAEAVLGKLLGSNPELRSRIKEIILLVREITEKVNSLTLTQQKELLSKLGPVKPVEKPLKTIGIPELPKAEGFTKITLRFAPNPDGPLTLGNARPAILCDYYARKTGGKLILRFEDTSPSVKPPLREAYEWVVEDLKWLGIEPDEIYYQSDRLPIYYDYATSFLEKGFAYVCLCKPGDFRSYEREGKPCPHRDHDPALNIRLWEKMLDGTMKPGEAVVRVKTDMEHPNPAVRDWPALRIDIAEHPRISGFRVWPLYNWSCAIDDYEMKISHVIRGKEHLTNEVRQSYVFQYLNAPQPVSIHIGRVGLENSVLSKSKIMKGFSQGFYTGLDDPRLGTLRALRRRGFKPEVIRRVILDMGLKITEAMVKWENLYAYNREVVDWNSERYYFVKDPFKLVVKNMTKRVEARLSRHPSRPELGFRPIVIEPHEGMVELLVSAEDVCNTMPGSRLRLISLFNVEIESVDRETKLVNSFFKGMEVPEKSAGIKLIQWVLPEDAVETWVLMPDASYAKGLGESSLKRLPPGRMVQLVRFGFCVVEKVSENFVELVFSHP
ncbi:MAG: glutamate--tRNA ligase [Candidatus Brockarchaeota archaeon]|nr:glutamate--tRNA ligase [Candidatus Brockarchaeota archaeon]